MYLYCMILIVENVMCQCQSKKLDRPELGRLLMDSHHNDILLVEQIDHLTRLSNSDWMTLKKQIEQHELCIVSLDVPTSWLKILRRRTRLPAQ